MKKFCIYFLMFTSIGVFPSYSFNPREGEKPKVEVEEKQEIQETQEENKEVNLETESKVKPKSKVLEKDNKKLKIIKPKEKILTPLEYYNKGRESFLKFNIKGYEESIIFYNKALELDKNFAKALAAKAESQAFLSKLIYDSTNNIKDSSKFESEAFNNAFIAVSMEPKLSETHKALSWVYLIQKKYDDGKEQALKAIEINENDAELQLLVWLNSPDKKLLRRENTIENYYKSLDIDSEIIDKSLELDSNFQVTLLEIANTFANQNELNQAIKYYNKLLKINPYHEDAYMFLANAYMKNDNNDKALDNFDKLLEINPDRYDAIFGLGLTYVKKRDSQQALEYINKACDYEFQKACDLLDDKTRRNNRRNNRLRRQFNNNMNLFNQF